MNDLIKTICITVLMVLGFCSILNSIPVPQVNQRDLASIYTDLHQGGGR